MAQVANVSFGMRLTRQRTIRTVPTRVPPPNRQGMLDYQTAIPTSRPRANHPENVK